MTLKTRSLAIFCTLAAGVCAAHAADPPIEPAQATRMAAANGQFGVSGLFAMRVRSASARSGTVYLNSELDERDITNLSLALPRDIDRKLTERYGAPPSTALIGKDVLVTGVAKRVMVPITKNGKRTLAYSPQTQIRISDAANIQLAKTP